MMRRPSNSGIAIWVAASSGVSPSSLSGPLGAGGGQAQALQDRHVQAGERADVPFLVGTARAGGRRDEAARREHGHDDRVRGAQRVDQRGLGGPQRRAEHRERPPARRRRPRRRARARSRCSPPRDGRGSTGWRRPGAVLAPSAGTGSAGPVEHSPGGHRHGGFESLAGQRDRVRQEPGELPQVLRAAVRQVRVRLGDDPRRHRRQLHELGVRRLLAAEHDGGHPGGQHRVEPVFPGPPPAEDADDDDVRAVEQGGHVVRGRGGRGCRAGSRRRSRGPTAGRCPRWTARRSRCGEPPSGSCVLT